MGDGNRDCGYCMPNGVRSSQVAVWVPQCRKSEGSHHIFVLNLVSSSLQADGINFHGYVHDSEARNIYIENTGDDVYALWGASENPERVAFKDSVAVNPGILRPNWYGVCVATYGLKSLLLRNITCRMPTLEAPLPAPWNGDYYADTSMSVFYTSFGASYPPGNRIFISGWNFEDLEGNPYSPETGTMDKFLPEKMVWTESANGVVAPYYIMGDESPKLNVYASARDTAYKPQSKTKLRRQR